MTQERATQFTFIQQMMRLDEAVPSFFHAEGPGNSLSGLEQRYVYLLADRYLQNKEYYSGNWSSLPGHKHHFSDREELKRTKKAIKGEGTTYRRINEILEPLASSLYDIAVGRTDSSE